MMPRVLTILAVALLAARAAAASPRDEVLRLVPEDVGFCLLVQDLRGHARAFLDSPFVTHFAASPLGAKVARSPEADTLRRVKANVEALLGLPLAQLRDDVLGDAVILAYRPGPVHNPDDEQGMLALYARDPALVARLYKRVNQVQRQSGELKEVVVREHRGIAYHRRVLAEGSNYCLAQGPLFVFATQEALLRAVIDRHLADGPAEDSPVARQFRALGVENRFAALWVNPRTFEPALRRRAEEAGGLRAAALRALLAYWQALDGVALSLAVRKDLELSLTVRAR